MKLIIDIPEEIKAVIDKNGTNEFVAETLWQAAKNGTPIPENAINGDVIKAMFPYGKYNEYFADVEMKMEENDTRFKSVFDRDWWNEPYQKGETNEKEIL